MSSAKHLVQRILDDLPEDVGLEEIQYRIYVRQKIDRGLEDVAEGNVIDQKQVEERIARWTGK